MRGHIRKRGRSWAVVVYVGRDASGRKRQRWFTYRTRGEAERHAAQLAVQMHGGSVPGSERLRCGEFLGQWLRDHARARVAPSTYARYAWIVERRLVPAFATVPLARLGPQQIQRYLADRLSSGADASTVRYEYSVLRAALGRAERWGLIVQNPARRVDPPARPVRERMVWDEEQARLFLAEARRSSPHYALYLLALLAGLRQAELVGLRWRDVDLATRTIVVRQTISRLYGRAGQAAHPGGALVVKAPKSSRPRVVPIPDAAVRALEHRRDAVRRQRDLIGREYQDRDLVFCQPNGAPLHAANLVRRDFQPLVARAGLPRIRFHDLRHVCATHLYRLSHDARTVQTVLGHASAAFTLETYAHPMARDTWEAMQRWADRLTGGGAC